MKKISKVTYNVRRYLRIMRTISSEHTFLLRRLAAKVHLYSDKVSHS